MQSESSSTAHQTDSSQPTSSLPPAKGFQRLRTLVQRALAHSVVLLLAVMVVNVLWQISSRYLLGRPSAVTEEIARYLLIWLGLFGGAYAASTEEHIALDLLPIPEDVQNLVRRTAMSLFGIVLMLGGLRLVVMVHQLHQRSAALHIPLSWVYFAAPAAGALIVFFANTPAASTADRTTSKAESRP